MRVLFKVAVVVVKSEPLYYLQGIATDQHVNLCFCIKGWNVVGDFSEMRELFDQFWCRDFSFIVRDFVAFD